MVTKKRGENIGKITGVSLGRRLRGEKGATNINTRPESVEEGGHQSGGAVTCQVMHQIFNQVSHYGISGHYDQHHPY